MRFFNNLRLSLSLLTGHDRRYFAVLCIIMLISGILNVLMVASVQPIITIIADYSSFAQSGLAIWSNDLLHVNSKSEALYTYSLISIFLISSCTLMILLRTYMISYFTFFKIHTIALSSLKRILSGEYEEQVKYHSSFYEAITLSETEQVVSKFFRPITNMCSAFFMIIFLVGFLLYVSPQVTCIVIIFFSIFYYVVYGLINPKTKILGVERAYQNKKRFHALKEILGSLKLIKMRVLEDLLFARFNTASRIHASTLVRSKWLENLPNPMIQGITYILLVCYLVGVEIRVEGNKGEIIASTIAFLFAFQRLLPEVQKFFIGLNQLNFAEKPLTEIVDFIMKEQEYTPEYTDDNLTFFKRIDQVSLVNVDKNHDNLKVLSNINLRILRGDKVGIIGPSGCGKSTLLDIISGLRRVDDGIVSINGQNINTISHKNLTNLISYVPQKTQVYEGSLLENITLDFGDEQHDDYKLSLAIEASGLSKFITSLDNGIYHDLLEGGENLSGGQLQRIGIARGLYHAHELLILDECTSALDTNTQKHILDCIVRIYGNLTVLFVTHRLETLANLDKIIELNAGEISYFGNTDDWDKSDYLSGI